MSLDKLHAYGICFSDTVDGIVNALKSSSLFKDTIKLHQ